jgi:hypothetical protein
MLGADALDNRNTSTYAVMREFTQSSLSFRRWGVGCNFRGAQQKRGRSGVA